MILLYLLVAVLYLAAAWMQSRRLEQPAPSSSRKERAGAALILLALTAHAVLLGRAFAVGGLDLSFAHALSLVALLVTLLAWAGGSFRMLPGVALIALPVACLCAILPAVIRGPHPLAYLDQPWATAHIAVALIAYSLFIVAALQAMVLMGLERRLHRGDADPDGLRYPPLLTLERFLFRLVTVGYLLLTLTVLSGIVFSEEIFGQPLKFNHKTVFSLSGWLVFTALLIGRHRYGWRGRTALCWIIGGTALLFLAYVGSKFVLEVLLHR